MCCRYLFIPDYRASEKYRETYPAISYQVTDQTRFLSPSCTIQISDSPFQHYNRDFLIISSEIRMKRFFKADSYKWNFVSLCQYLIRDESANVVKSSILLQLHTSSHLSFETIVLNMSEAGSRFIKT